MGKRHQYECNYLFKVFILLLVANIPIIQSQIYKNPEFVYSSQYEYRHDITESQGLFNNLKVAKNANLVFIAAGDSGIKVLNPHQNYDIVYTFRSTEYIQGFTTTKDANYVFLPFQKKLTVYDFSDRQNFVQIGQDNVKTEIIDYLINEAEDLIFIIQATGHIRALNIKDKSNPKFAGSVIWHKQQIYSGVISADDQWLLICQDQKGLGIFKLNKQLDGTVTFILAGSFKESKSQGVEITNNMKYIVNIDNRQGVSIGDFSVVLGTNTNSYPMNLQYFVKQWWPTEVTIPSPYSLCISDDDNFLFMGVLAQGVFIIDISDKNKPVLFQTIIIPFHGMSVKLSADEKDLFYVNAESVYIFRKIKPNLNQQYLNLFNSHLSNSYQQSPTYYYWRCYIDDERNLYFGAFDDDGLWVIDISDPKNMNALKSSFQPTNNQGIVSIGDIDALIFLQGHKYMIVPVFDKANILAVYDTSSILAPPHNLVLVQLIPFNSLNYIVDFDLNANENLLVAALGDSVIFIDVKTIGQFSVIASWEFTEGMKGDCTGVIIIKNDQYVVGASRGYGYFVLDIKNLKNIKMVQYIDSLGAENILASSKSSDYCFFIDGLKGVQIIDLKELPKINIISTIQVPGWSNDITLINDETIMLVSSLEKSMLNMVDITNIYKPFIVSEYHYETQNGMSTCATANNEYVFINNNIGVRALPTKGDVQLHIEMQEILGFSEELNQFHYRKIGNQEVLLVGQTIQLDMVFLYQPLDLVVHKLWFYQAQTMHELPNWITYDPDEVQVKMQLVKESIDPTNTIEQTLNIIVVQTIKPLYQEDFVFTDGDCKTNNKQAQAIYEKLFERGILNGLKVINPKLDFTNEQQIIIKDNILFPDSTFNTCLSKLIKYTLHKSIQYTPIYLQMKNSLNLDFKPEGDNFYINTIAKYLKVSIIIPRASGQFIYEVDIGVNITINQEKNNLRIEGSLENIDSFLKKKIIIFPSKGQKYADLIAQLIIQDSINYNIDKTLHVEKIPFLAEKINISVDPNSTLQKQLESKYENSEIEIISDFLFQFDENTFVSPDVKTIKYTAMIEDNGVYRPIETNDWIDFNPQFMIFRGNPPQSSFRDTVRIKVTGDDGYTQISDEFKIQIYILPVNFVITWIAQILGPILAVILFYKYKYFFYNAIFDSRNSYSKVTAEVNKKFMIKIPLIQNEIQLSKKMIESLITRVQHSSGFQASNIDIYKISKYNASKIEYPQIDDFEKEQEDKAILYGYKKEDIEENAALKIIGQDDNNKAHSLTEANTHFTSGSNSSNVMNTDKHDINLNFNEKIRKAKEYIPTNQIEKRYLNTERKIDMDSVINDMIKFNVEFKLNGKYHMASQYKEELQNKKSTLHKCIKFLLARYLLSLDQKTYLVVKYIKYYGMKNSFLYSNNDWYKQFVNVIADDKLDSYGLTIFFPKIQLILENIKNTLMYIQLLSSRMDSFMTLREQGINPYLIKYFLQAEALGIDFKSPSSFFPCLGESIHLKSHQLKSVESFKYSPEGFCYPLKRVLNLDYESYGPKNNTHFPSWLQLVMQPGLIILQGTPQYQDMEEILIRFYGTQGYIYKSFILRVEDNDIRNSSSISAQTEQQNDNQKIGRQGSIADENAPIINKQQSDQSQVQQQPVEILKSLQNNIDDFGIQQILTQQSNEPQETITEMVQIKSQQP